MCELLLMMEGAAIPANPQRGDVIVAMPDGHAWGNYERESAQFRLLRFSHTPLSWAMPLLSPESATAPGPDPMLQYRGFCLDLAHPALAACLDDTGRNTPVFDIPATLCLSTLVRQRDRLNNPTVIG